MTTEQAPEKKDVSVLKAMIAEVAADIKLGKAILKDGVNAEDVKFVPEASDHVKAVIALAGKAKEAGLEISDIDANEVVELLLAAWSGVQEVLKD